MSEASHFEVGLDENIWEFEWKRLEKHSRKILAPVILLGKLHTTVPLAILLATQRLENEIAHSGPNTREFLSCYISSFAFGVFLSYFHSFSYVMGPVRSGGQN